MLRSVYAEETNPDYHKTSSNRYENHIKSLHKIYQQSQHFIRDSRNNLEKKFNIDAMVKQQNQIEDTFTNGQNQKKRNISHENKKVLQNLKEISLRNTQHSFNKLSNPNNKTDSQ